MKTDYTIQDLNNMTVKELRRVLGKQNTEARKRASRLKAKGYEGKMTSPNLDAVRGLKKAELMEAILDKSQAYLRDKRSTVKGMRKFEKNVINTINRNFNNKRKDKFKLQRKDLDSFVDYLDTISDLWGSLRYPSKYAVQTFTEMTKMGLGADEIKDGFKEWLKTESGMLDLKEVLEKARRKGETLSADEVRARLRSK